MSRDDSAGGFAFFVIIVFVLFFGFMAVLGKCSTTPVHAPVKHEGCQWETKRVYDPWKKRYVTKSKLDCD